MLKSKISELFKKMKTAISGRKSYWLKNLLIKVLTIFNIITFLVFSFLFIKCLVNTNLPNKAAEASSPSNLSITPNAGSISGGEEVTITGQGFVKDYKYKRDLTITNTANNSQNFVDMSGTTPKTLTPNGDAKLSNVNKKYGTFSGLFDGTGDYVESPNVNDFKFGTGDFTVEGWVNVTTNGGYKSIVSTRAGAINEPNAYTLTISPSNQVVWYSNAFILTSPSAITTGSWNHIAVVRNGTTLQLYVNGNSVASATDTRNYNTLNNFTIGANNNGSEPFLGNLDDLRITKGLARYTANFTAPTAALTSDSNTVLLMDFEGTLRDYQYQTTIDTATLITNGKMKADCNDLRIKEGTDGTTDLNYWIEDGTCNTATTRIWIKDTSVPNGTSKVLITYGNASLSSLSNGENVFEFFDNFSGSAINTTKWTETDTANNFSQTGGQIQINNGTGTWGGTALFSNQTFARSNLEFRYDFKPTCTAGPTYHVTTMLGWKDGGSGTSYADMPYATYFYKPTTGSSDIVIYEDGTGRGTVSSFTCNTQYYGRMQMKASGGATYFVSTDKVNWTQIYNSTYSTESNLKIGFTHYQGGINYFDNAVIRKFSASEPTLSLATETTATTATFGGSNCTNIVVQASDRITCTTPARSAGLVNLVVTNPNGVSATLTNGYQYVNYGNINRTGLIGFFDANNSASISGQTIKDLSGMNYSATLGSNSSASTDDPSRISTSPGYWQFDGSNDLISTTVPSNFGTYNGYGCGNYGGNPSYGAGCGLTFEVWFKRANNNNTGGSSVQQRLITAFKDGAESTRTALGLQNTTTQLRATNNYNTNFVANTEWQMITFTLDENTNQTSKVYMNGVLHSTANLNLSLPNSNTISIGSNTLNNYFQGNIANIKIYNRALTQNEITTNFNNDKSSFGFTGATVGINTPTTISFGNQNVLNSYQNLSMGIQSIEIVDRRSNFGNYSITIAVSDFVLNTDNTKKIPASNITLSPNSLILNTGSGINTAVGSTITFEGANIPKTLYQSTAPNGGGKFIFQPDLNIETPSFSRSGTYTANLTVNIL
jgi:Concanavalin A-like lectin/glucanases superfamily/Domain of unknown function (DUF2341)/IPT/TIG domain